MLDLVKQNQRPYLNDFHKFSCFVKLFELMMVASAYLESKVERREWINRAGSYKFSTLGLAISVLK